jgi:hypothetical protein
VKKSTIGQLENRYNYQVLFDNNQRFRIGSDEPQQLLQAIQQQLSKRK